MSVAYDVVVPTVGRESLRTLLDALSGPGASGPLPARVIVVDDRRDRAAPLPLPPAVDVVVLPGPARGPAAARNVGWRAGRSPWVAFLDDDVLPPRDWRAALARDLDAVDAEPHVGGSQGVVTVPLPAGRRPTDWERNVAGLQDARWITADMAYRRRCLASVGGFDERFPRAYREDADIALRAIAKGWSLVQGERRVEHPVRPADRWVSVRAQAGNADDPLMRALHGRGWRSAAGVARGSRRAHALTTAAGFAALWSLASGRGHRRRAALATAAWCASTARFAWRRIAPGPRTRDEVVTMVLTSIAIPPVAIHHWLRGWLALPRSLQAGRGNRPSAVLFDRDGTLVVDVPYNGDAGRVEVVHGARRAVDRLRAAGIATGIITNQSGVARGLVTREQVDVVNAQVERLLGPLGPVAVCPHGPDDGCGCRKPRPGLVVEAADALGLDAADVVVIGDIGADVEAAHAAGARAVLVPTPATRQEEIASAPLVAPDLDAAIDLVLGAS
jgi:histidinol-phosphate phosphatase family protein